MQFRMMVFSFVTALAVTGLAEAQTEPAGEADTATETAPEAAPPAAQETPQGPQPGQTYVAEEHGDWQLRCVAVEEGVEPCQIYQVMTDENGGPVAEIVVFPLPEGQQAAAGAVVTTPLETLLTEGVTIAVDGTEGKRYPFTFCTAQGCVARFGLSTEDIGAFQRGNVARVGINPLRAPERQVILEISLTGFTAGFNALRDRLQN